MADNTYILAMYDIRGKQNFIYKSNRMKEIVGASYLIRDCFKEFLYPAAAECFGKGIFCYKDCTEESDGAFTEEGFKKHMNQDGYIGEVVYDGGGNFFVLYKDKGAYQKVNRHFYRRLLEGTYSLWVLTSYIEGVDFDNYRADQARLYEIHRRREREESTIPPVNTLPVVQTDYRTSLPLAAVLKTKAVDGKLVSRKVSYESKMKYEKYKRLMDENSEDRQIRGTQHLDELVTEKGKESLLAVIHIDGNSMGAQVEKCLDSLKNESYEECVNELRRFSQEIQKNYISDRIEDINKILEGRKGIRFVVYAGDDMTFICNARDAYDVVMEYFRGLAASESANDEEGKRTSCAGIAIFHSHAPFADAYRIAEECSESGKKLMKEEGITNASLIDFHYCQGAFGTSLEQIREEEATTECSRPWFVRCVGEDGTRLIREKYVSIDIVEKMRAELKKAGRGNIKNLAFSAKKSAADFKTEQERIKAHQTEKEIDFSLGGLLDDEMQRKLIYDMVLVYDLWFDRKETKGE